jgi:hypothetical protein
MTRSIGWFLPYAVAKDHGSIIAEAVYAAFGRKLPAELEAAIQDLDRIAVRWAARHPQHLSSSGGSSEFIGEKLTAQQVSARIGASPSYVARLCRAGRLDGYQLPNRTWQIDAESVDNFTKGRGPDGTSSTHPGA